MVRCDSCLVAEFPHGHVGLCLENPGECCGGKITAKGGDGGNFTRTVGEKPDVASITQRRGERLKAWLKARAIYPEGATTQLSDLVPQAFDDFAHVVRLIEYTRLGRGEKGRRYLDVTARELAEAATLGGVGCTLTCNDLALTKAQGESEHED